jgi:hypothetical protein
LDYTATNGRIITEWGGDVDGIWCGLIEALSKHLSEGTEKTHATRIRIRISNRSITTVNRQSSSRLNYERSRGHFELMNSMEQLVVSQLLKMPPVFCGSWKFMTVFTRNLQYGINISGRDSWIGIVTRLDVLEDQWIGARFAAGLTYTSLLNSIPISSGTHPTF